MYHDHRNILAGLSSGSLSHARDFDIEAHLQQWHAIKYLYREHDFHAENKTYLERVCICRSAEKSNRSFVDKNCLFWFNASFIRLFERHTSVSQSTCHTKPKCMQRQAEGVAKSAGVGSTNIKVFVHDEFSCFLQHCPAALPPSHHVYEFTRSAFCFACTSIAPYPTACAQDKHTYHRWRHGWFVQSPGAHDSNG